MARARNIKPGFFKNEILGVADPLYSLLFEGLWVLADREGRLEDRPLRIKGEIFPYREGLDMNAMLDWLAENGFIQRYTSKGKKCILVLEFVKHQNPHKNETDSELPAPDEVESVSEEIGSITEKIGTTRADSLSSDSLIPDSHTACASACALTPGDVCKAMKLKGIGDTNPGNQTLKTLLEAGAALDEFTGAAQKSAGGGKGFVYALGIVKRDREQAAALVGKLHRGELPTAETAYQRSMRERVEQVAPSIARRDPNANSASPVQFFEALDVSSRVVPMIASEVQQ